MKIAVPLKYVPDTETIVRIADDGKSLNPDGVQFVMNPYDEYAIEESLRIKESLGGEITVITVGDESAAKVLRNGIALGADIALRINNDGPYDPSMVAWMLAEAIKDSGFDIIFLGMKAVDDDSGAVGPMLAEYLGLPCVTMVIKLEIGDGKATARRENEYGTEVVESTLPAVFTAQKGLNEPRYPKLKGMSRARKHPIDVIEPKTVSPGIEVLEMKLPPARKAGKIVGEGVEAVPELVRLLRDEAKLL